MSQQVQQRINLDFNIIDDQLKAWLHEGHATSDIIAQAAHTWPSLPADYVRASIRLLSHVITLSRPLPIQPMRDLSRVHRKRSKRLKQIEAQLTTTAAPVSLQTLYRGMLRDHEASCYKIMALQRQTEQDDRKNAQQQQQEQRRQAKEQAQQLNQILKHHQQLREEEEDNNKMEQASPVTRNFTTTSWLIALVLASLLLFSSNCNSKQHLGQQQSDTWIITPNTSSMAIVGQTAPVHRPASGTVPRWPADASLPRTSAVLPFDPAPIAVQRSCA